MSPRSPESNVAQQDSKSPELPPEVASRVRELEALRLLRDRNAETELIRLIEKYPQLSETCGDLGQQAIASWVDRIAGTDLVFRAALFQKVKLLRERFPISDTDPTTEMLVGRIVATWLQSTYADSRVAQLVSQDRAEQDSLLKRQQMAQRQHLEAVEAWRLWRSAKPHDSARDARTNRKVSGSSIVDQDRRDILPFPHGTKSA